jgi:ribonuclease D
VAENLSLSQQKYASSDVLYLHKLMFKLNEMLIRENRIKLAKGCFDFIEHRVKLDLSGWSEMDIFKH